MNFEESKITDCDFGNSNLSESSFKESYLSGSIFDNCNLQKTDFRNSKDYSFNINKNKVKGAKFSYPEALNLLNVFEIKID